jgi:thiol-disulfide isomerase/thioredoxin
MRFSRLSLLCIVLLCSSLGFAKADEPKKVVMPSATIKTIKGQVVNSNTIHNDGKPMFVSFWATWCKPCIQELNALSSLYDDWRKETGVKIVAISTDDVRNSAKVAPFVNGKRWEYEVYIDENGDLRRAMNVNNVPHSFLIDGNGKVVWQHNSYAPGDEMKLYEVIKQVAAGQEVKEK